MPADGTRRLVLRIFSLGGFALSHAGVVLNPVRAVAEEGLQVGALHQCVVVLAGEDALRSRRVAEGVSLLPGRIAERRLVHVQFRVEVINEALLTHVVHRVARCVESAILLALVGVEHLLEHLSQHLRVHGYLLVEGLVLADGEVVAVERVENVAERLVGQREVDPAPVDVVDGLEETSVQKRHATAKGTEVIVPPAAHREALVEQRFEDVPVEVLVVDVRALVQLP